MKVKSVIETEMRRRMLHCWTQLDDRATNMVLKERNLVGQM